MVAPAAPDDARHSPFRSAIDDTIRTIEWRARGHRVLAALVLATPPAAAVFAVVRRSWAPMAFMVCLVPLFAALRCAEIWLLCRWERRIIDRWREGELDLEGFRTAIGAVRSLPPDTLAGMLAVIPAVETIGPATTPSFRSDVAMTLHLISECDAWCGALRTTARAVAVTSLLVALARWSGRPWVIVAVAAAALEMSEWLLRRAACSVWRRRIAPVRGEDGARLAAFASRVDWRTIPCVPPSHPRVGR